MERAAVDERQAEGITGMGMAVSEGAADGAGDAAEAADAGGQADDLARLRAALLRAYPETVEELVGGASVGELLDSLEVAGAAWRKVATRAAAPAGEVAAPGDGAATGVAPVPAVPAGDGRPLAADPEQLPATEKIRRGLAGRG